MCHKKLKGVKVIKIRLLTISTGRPILFDKPEKILLPS